MPYLEALEGFEQVCRARLTEFRLSRDLDNQREVAAEIETLKPGMILALGARAAYAVSSEIREIPILFAMISSPEHYGITGPNVTGIKSSIPIETRLGILKNTIPGLKRIGIIYGDPGLDQWLREARVAAGREELELLPVRIGSLNDLPEALEELLPRIDLLWLVYDPVVTASRKVIQEWIMLPALRRKVPVAGFNKWTVTVGALLCIYADYRQMGEQAGEMANRLLAGDPPSTIPPQSPAEPRILINPSVARRLGISIPSRAYIYSDEDYESF